MHDQVTARAGGRDLTLKIARGDLPAFEVATGWSAFAVLKAIHAGAWTVAQIKSVVAFALLPAQELKQARMVANLPGVVVGFSAMPRNREVERMFALNPPAVYAPLAEAILGAALFGITAEEAAFTDEPDGA